MKKLIASVLALSLLGVYATLPASAASTETISYTYDAGRWETKTRGMEKLDRGLVAVKTNDGVFLSWRLMDSEDARFGSAEKNVSFDIYRDGEKIATEDDTTNYLDTSGTAKNSYCVVPAGESPYTRASIAPATGAKTGMTIKGNIADRFAKVYAAKYDDNGVLSDLAQYEPEDIGEFIFEPGFRADKIFVWRGMKPVNGAMADSVTPMSQNYFDIPLQKPAAETIVQPDGTVQDTYSFFPADCSTGDLDGDGEYEIIVKWTSSERDVGSPGDPAYSGTVRFAAYKLDGTKLWDKDINLGKNVYSSAHTAQFLVYDFDGDGKSEMMVQTSLGSTDGNGEYVSKAADPVTNPDIYNVTDQENAEADYRGDGRIITGEEFLTVFNGETGAAMDTINLPTARIKGNKGQEFGDDFGNRSNRFVASVAYLDGEKPYAVYLRGYYFGRNGKQRTSIAGISFENGRLNAKYRFDTEKGQPGYYNGAYKYVGNGNHNCTVADVDGDGKDEFITGALCMEVKEDDSFKPKWCTFMEHGDALHIGDYDPTHTGFEFFTIHEDGGPNTQSAKSIEINYGMSVIDPGVDAMDSDEEGYQNLVMFHEGAGGDTGRGIMANIGMGGYYQFWSSGNELRIANGGTRFSPGSKNGLSQNFRIFWDGDLYDELLDGTTVTSWNGGGMDRIFNATGCSKINGTKSNPGLQADLFGDWREELVYPTTDGNKLRVFTTTTPTNYKIKTLMHDPVYRSGVAAEQTAYNQPPHVGIYMGEEIFDAPTEKIEILSAPDTTVYALGQNLNTEGLKVKAYLEDGTEKEVTLYTVDGYDANTPGEQTITVTYQGKSATFKVTVKAVESIKVTPPEKTAYYQGQQLDISGMVVTATFTDGSSSVVTGVYEYEGYNSSVIGEQTITVTYGGKSDTFTVTVEEGQIAAFNNTYETTSTESDLTELIIGNYSGDFTLKHTVTINSMPKDGGWDKNSTEGFFVRFMPQATGSKNGVGAGWQLMSGWDDDIYVAWKSDRKDGPTFINFNNALETGKTYTFTYNFTNVGTGDGALVDLTITDADGNEIGSGTGLSLRNMTSSDNHKSLPLNYIQIFNQANENSTASVTIGDAKIFTGEEPVEEHSGPYDLTVTVTDTDGAPVPDTTVMLAESRTTGEGDDSSGAELAAVSLSAVTDEDGVATFTEVPSGAYRLTATAAGIGTAIQTVRLDGNVRQISKSIKLKKLASE